MNPRRSRLGPGALGRAVREGVFFCPAEHRIVQVTPDFLLALHQSVSVGGYSALEVMYQVGLDWGRRWMHRADLCAEPYEQRLRDLELDDLEWFIHDEMCRSGWGQPSFDAESYGEQGLLIVTIGGGPASTLVGAPAEGVAMMQGGFLAGAFGILTGVPMAGLGYILDNSFHVDVEVVVAHEARISRIWIALEQGLSWPMALRSAG